MSKLSITDVLACNCDKKGSSEVLKLASIMFCFFLGKIGILFLLGTVRKPGNVVLNNLNLSF